MSSEWELSKENVQPLKQGRDVVSMTAGLQPQDSDLARIREEKRNFEAEIRTYTGEDPLEVWYRYVRWAEQTFPKGGKMSLSTLIQDCISHFLTEDRYRNDERYVYVWIQMAEHCKTPLDIYSYMYDQKIGCELSSFYVGWANVLEQCGNTKRADAIYNKGFECGATPYDCLRKKHEEFQKRVARGLLSGEEQMQTQDETPHDENERQALSRLKTMGKKHLAPSNRTGDFVKGSAGVYSTGAVSQSQTKRTIQVHCDENQDPSKLQSQTGEWASMPRDSIVNRENEKKAGKWTKAKLPQSAINVPLTDANAFRQPSFSVHVEENAQVMRTPAKTQEIGRQVLSSRKAEKDLDSRPPIIRSGYQNLNATEKPMYCKDKIYCGTEEYSFEELRSVRWLKREEKTRKREAEQAAREELERQTRMLAEERETQRLQNMRFLEEQSTMLESVRQNMLEQQEQFERQLEMRVKMQVEELQQSIQGRVQEQEVRSNTLLQQSVQGRVQEQVRSNQPLQQSNSIGSSRQLVFDEGTHGNTENVAPSMQSHVRNNPNSCSTNILSRQQEEGGNTENISPSVQVQLQAQARGDNSINSSTNSLSQQREEVARAKSFQPKQDSNWRSNLSQTRLDSSANSSTGELLHKTMDGGASPTVFTKEAFGLVRKMFNVNLESDKRPDDDVNMSELPEPVSAPQVQATGGASSASCPFVIFDESSQKSPAIPNVPFTVLSDRENIPVTKTETRNAGMDSLLSVGSQSAAVGSGNRVYEMPLNSFEDEDMDCFLSHAREDITVAPVGSSLSFAAAARLASTPSSGGLSTNVNMDDSDLEPCQPCQPSQPCVEATSLPAEEMESESSLHKRDGSENISVLHTSGDSFRKDLSPIMEGSSEESDSHGKSQLKMMDFSSALHTLPEKLDTVFDQTEDTSCLLQGNSFGNQSNHLIDTSAYVLPEINEKTENLLSMSLCLQQDNPFDKEVHAKFLRQLREPLFIYDNYVDVDEEVPDISTSPFLGGCIYEFCHKIGEGGFAKVYLAEEIGDNTCLIQQDKMRALKVEKPPSRWEFYICYQVQERLSALKDPVDVRPSFMEILHGYFFTDGSVLVSQYQDKGTLLDMVNCWKQSHTTIQQKEAIIAYMTIELIHAIENLHRCQIIHGDIKPDNFMVLSFPRLPVSKDPVEVFKGRNRFTQLIDFGQSIDMTLYPENTNFLAKVNTNCFQCIEMKTDQPWTYQVDLFGLAGTIHVLVFSQYMNVYQEAGVWHMTSRFPRSWHRSLWSELFTSLLNVPSCFELPNLSELRHKFERYFVDNQLSTYNSSTEELNALLKR